MKRKAGTSATRRLLGKSVCLVLFRSLFGEIKCLHAYSVNSIDEIVSIDDTDEVTWTSRLSEKIDEVIDRKRSSNEGREAALSEYIRFLTARYVGEDLQGRENDLLSAFAKSVKQETSEKETILALKGMLHTTFHLTSRLTFVAIALAITLITRPAESIYDAASTLLKRTATDSESIPTKTAALHTLGACTFYGGASDDEILDIMTFLLEVVSSDGNSISAPDEASPVAAALEEWGFLATLIDDLSGESEEAMEAFLDQLESNDPSVQIAAGENIALLYEKSYTPPEDDETFSDSDDDNLISDPESGARGPALVKRYTPYHRTDQVLHTLQGLASFSARNMSKKDKKSLHTNFADILSSVENPTRGPRYQKAINCETGKSYGSRMAVRIGGEGVMKIDQWWKMMRLKGLRRVLQGGFVRHYETNPVVFESLPIMIQADKSYKSQKHLTVPGV